MTQLTVVEYRVQEVYARVEKFNRKAKKLNLPAITVAKTGSKVRKFRTETADGVTEQFELNFVTLELTGDIPRIDGWAIHSKVEPSGVFGQNFVYSQPGFEPVEGLRTTKMICEHCNHNRARSLVYLLQNIETGEQKLVGKTCLKDFLPNIDVAALLSYLEGFRELSSSDADEDYERAPRAEWMYSVQDLIAECLYSIRKIGYRSKKAARDMGEEGTETSAWIGISDVKKREKLYPSAELRVFYETGEIDKVVDFIKAMNPRDDFGYNLQLAVEQVNAPVKMFGFVAAGVNMYIKATEKAAEATNKTNEWVGTVGKREVFSGLKIVRCTATEGHYGTTFVTGFEDEAGRTFIWFASSKIGDVGEVMDLKATVKEHGEYKGTKQTVITRATKM
jgi:hypothetical protein